MAKHRRTAPGGTSFQRLLSAVWRHREAQLWVVRGYDEFGRSAWARVEIAENGVSITTSSAGEIVLPPLQAGRLRRAIKTAIVALDQPRMAVEDMPPPARRQEHQEPWPPSPRPRERVVLGDREKPTEPYAEFQHLLARYFTEEDTHVYYDTARPEPPSWPEHDVDEPVIRGMAA